MSNSVSLSGPIFHYTSIAALQGIVESKQLWCSNISYLNDSSELSYGLDSFIKVAATFRSSIAGDLLELWDEVIDIVLDLRLKHRPYEIYVSSFSEVNDDLGQWRAYCDSGTGVCIGFSHHGLYKHMRTQGFDFCKCIYNEAEQMRDTSSILKGVLDDCRDVLSKANGDIQSCKEQIRKKRTETFLRWGLQLKHGAFQAEQEWRWVLISDKVRPDIRFRNDRKLLIPYVGYQLADLLEPCPITSIVIGPGGEQELNQQAIQQFLLKHQVHVPVTISRVPYRGQ